jgi:hypothetical protein
MTEYEVAPDGERVSTRYAPGYFAMMRDFARTGQLSGTYGSSMIVGPAWHSARSAAQSRNLSLLKMDGPRDVSRPSREATARQATSLDMTK